MDSVDALFADIPPGELRSQPAPPGSAEPEQL